MYKKRFNQLQKIARSIRLQVLEMIMRSKSAHIGSSLSAVEILASLYFGIMKINPRNSNDANRDRFILSKGHAASALYATLAVRGFFSEKILDTYCSDGGRLSGHSTKSCVPGVEVSTGSLGHGLAMANGIAIVGKRDKKNYHVFVLLSDGECDEGSTWEAILFAGHHKLDNLVAIVDYNKWQAFGRTKDVLNLEPFAKKWRDFDWAVKEANGHNFQEIFKALEKIPFQKNKPSVLIAHTIKAKGLSSMEDKLESHYRPPTEKEYKIALQEINNL